MGNNDSMLIIQDDAYSGALHLDEVLLSAIPEAEGGAATFAFVTKDGLNAIFNSEEFRNFCKTGHHFELYVGIDSVTTEDTLAFAKKLSSDLGGRLIVKVYYDDSTPNIFHAKTTWFRNPEGDGCVAFVGSGNLTMRGLQKNVEMFSWIEQDRSAFKETLETWNGWLADAARAGRVHDVDNPKILKRASENKWEQKHSLRYFGEDSPSIAEDLSPEPGKSVMISAIPRQESRGWSQFAMAKEYYQNFFGFGIDETGADPVPAGNRRILLRAVDENGTLHPAESRAGNISSSSRNFRMELGAAKSVFVAVGDNPIAVFLKTGPRTYLYQIFGSNSPWSKDLKAFAKKSNPKLPENQLPKCWIEPDALRAQFPELPILNAKQVFDG